MAARLTSLAWRGVRQGAREDFVGAPVWHADSDEDRTAAHFVACLGEAPRSFAYAARRKTMRGRDAGPYALARVRRIEPFRRVVRRPRAVRQELDLRAFNESRFMHVASYRNEHRPTRSYLQSERDAHN
jgi:hypothetical protein